jgi:cation transport ATPase
MSVSRNNDIKNKYESKKSQKYKENQTNNLSNHEVAQENKNNKKSKLSVTTARKVMKWISLVALFYLLLMVAGVLLMKNPAIYEQLTQLLNQEWLLLVIQLAVIVSSLWWYPLITKTQGIKKGWSPEKIDAMVNKKWGFVIFLLIIALVVRVIFLL